MEYNQNVEIIIKKLKLNGYNAYLVGGSVRDFLLKKNINDYDVSTNAKPDKIIEIFCHYPLITTGLKHGTVSVIVNREVIEITTFRKEGNYSDYRHPDSVEFVDELYEDLARRDFTINAMAYDNKIIDYFNSVEDIKKKVIRTVGNPDVRFKEDALRILRALRFSSVLGFSIENITKESIFRNYHLIENVALERITSEIKKMVSGDNFRTVFKEFYDVFNFIYNLNYSLEEIEKAYHAIISNNNKQIEFCFSIMFYYHSSLNETLKINKFSNKMIGIVNSIIQTSKKDLDTKTDILFAMKEKSYEIVYYGIILKGLFESNYEVQEKLLLIDSLKYCCFKIKDLNVTGTEILELGIERNLVGEVLNTLLDEVILGNIENQKCDLLKRGLKIVERKRGY